jgi:hypothetical protein
MKKLIVLTCVLLVAALTTYAQQNQTLHQGTHTRSSLSGQDQLSLSF